MAEDLNFPVVIPGSIYIDGIITKDGKFTALSKRMKDAVATMPVTPPIVKDLTMPKFFAYLDPCQTPGCILWAGHVEPHDADKVISRTQRCNAQTLLSHSGDRPWRCYRRAGHYTVGDPHDVHLVERDGQIFPWTDKGGDGGQWVGPMAMELVRKGLASSPGDLPEVGCPDCTHDWDKHAIMGGCDVTERFDGAVMRCVCTEPRPNPIEIGMEPASAPITPTGPVPGRIHPNGIDLDGVRMMVLVTIVSAHLNGDTQSETADNIIAALREHDLLNLPADDHLYDPEDGPAGESGASL